MVAGQEEERDVESEAGRNSEEEEEEEEEKKGRIVHLKEERENKKLWEWIFYFIYNV